MFVRYFHRIGKCSQRKPLSLRFFYRIGNSSYSIKNTPCGSHANADVSCRWCDAFGAQSFAKRNFLIQYMRKGDEDMDLMIGTIDSKRLRKDLLHRYRTSGKTKSPAIRHQIETVEMANEQQLVAIAKQEGMDLRPYIR